MLMWLALTVVCACVAALASSSFTENLTIRPLKSGNMLLDFSFHMEYVLRERCARRTHSNAFGDVPARHSMSCVSQNSGAPLELAQLYTLLPAEVIPTCETINGNTD